MRRIRPLAWVLLAAGMGLLALSFALEPTPTTYVLIHKQRVPVTHDNAVDYVIGFCRLAGVALVIAGAAPTSAIGACVPTPLSWMTDCRRRATTST